MNTRKCTCCYQSKDLAHNIDYTGPPQDRSPYALVPFSVLLLPAAADPRPMRMLLTVPSCWPLTPECTQAGSGAEHHHLKGKGGGEEGGVFTVWVGVGGDGEQSMCRGGGGEVEEKVETAWGWDGRGGGYGCRTCCTWLEALPVVHSHRWCVWGGGGGGGGHRGVRGVGLGEWWRVVRQEHGRQQRGEQGVRLMGQRCMLLALCSSSRAQRWLVLS